MLTDGISDYSSRAQLFNGTAAGPEVVTGSSQPLLDGARVLLAEGVDPATRIVMRDAGSVVDDLRSAVGAAVWLIVEEGERPPLFRLRLWQPLPHAAVTPPMRRAGAAVMSSSLPGQEFSRVGR